MGRFFVWLFFLLLMFTALPVAAEEHVEKESQAELVTRTEQHRHGMFTMGIVSKELQIWTREPLGHTFKDGSIGHFWPILHSKNLELGVGGFLAEVDDHGYFEPSLEFHGHSARLHYEGELSVSLPTHPHHGHRAVHSRGLFVGYQVNRRYSLGLATEFYAEAGEALYPAIGPEVRARLGKRTSVDLHLLHGHEGTIFGLALHQAY